MTITISETDPIYQVFQKVIKKHWKFQLISNSANIGNSLAIGNPGYGKTTYNRRECELRHDLNHKVFCLYDAGRMDMAYFMFPSVSDFWKKPKIEKGKIITPKKYPIELLYPITSNIPKKLPFNAIPFTIGINDLDDNDMTALVGSDSKDTIKGMLNYMRRKINKDTTPQDYLNYMGAALKKVEDTDEIKPSHFAAKKLKSDVLLPLINEGLLTSKNIETSIDIRELIKNKNISVLVLRHCPQQLWGFLVYFFLNHIFKILSGLGEEKKVSKRTTITMNEVPDLLVKDEDAGSSAGSISKMIEKIAKQYRTGNMHLLIDCQIPQELPDIKDTFSRVAVFNSGISELQKIMEIMGISTRSGQINQDDMMIIPRLPKGYYYLFDRNTGVSIHKLIWLRSRTYMDGEDFYDIYDKVYGKSSYINIDNTLEKLEDEKNRNEDLWIKVKKLKQKKEHPYELEFDEEIDNKEVYEEKKDLIEEEKKEDKVMEEIKIKEPKKEERKEKLTDWKALKRAIATS